MQRDLAKLTQGTFDLLVCGGGVYGAWTAYDAALRGLKVAIVEQGDWASATSSASSKLIHGGLRYLEGYDFQLVRKALAERQLYLDYAPHRVWPLRFGVPVYEDSRVGMLRLQAGLMLYDALARWPLNGLSHQHFDRKEFAVRFPFLKDDQLKGGFTYGDAQTDDARLVLELIDGAQQQGAVCVHHCRLVSISEEQHLANGATVIDQLSGAQIPIVARQIVNATGQWISTSAQGLAWCRMSKGVHLVLPGGLTEEALLLTAPQDGRVFFIIPWYGMTLLGTTDDDYRGDVDKVQVETSEVSYLLDAANHYLKHAMTESDIVGSYAGVRVMQRSDAAHPSQLSRDWVLRTADNGVHYSVGGKITSARMDASQIVDKVCAQLDVRKSCATKHPFPWTPSSDYSTWRANINGQAGRLNVDAQSTEWLIRRHGSRAAAILDSISNDATLAQRILPALPLIHADLLWCAQHEMVVHLDDLLRRRLPLLILARPDYATLQCLARQVAPILGWDEDVMSQEILRCLL